MAEKNGEDVIPKYFTETGHCTDEIKLLFDDGQVLFVSENLLTYASPVFKAMFDHNFIEKKDREVKLAEKKYDDFHEFLLYLHPAVQKKISRTNVLCLARIAGEYQVENLVTKCKTAMRYWLRVNLKRGISFYKNDDDLRNSAAGSLRILHEALECEYEDIVDLAITSLSKFGYGVFSGRLKLNVSLKSYGTTEMPNTFRMNYITAANEGDKKSECYDLFENLPEDIKYKLLTERLIVCDRNDMIDVETHGDI